LFKIVFDATGKFSKYLDNTGQEIVGTSGVLKLTSPNSAVGVFNVDLNISKATQYGTSFSVTDLRQDGYTAGDLTGITIGDDGKVTTAYSNGQTQVNSQISMVDFRNVQGLKPVGSGNWMETDKSGQPIQGAPGSGKFGKLRSGALEESNVDLTAELVNMMTAQRSYQANVQTIKTQDQALQSLVNLR
jgi:flagellar hook protein FlgE